MEFSKSEQSPRASNPRINSVAGKTALFITGFGTFLNLYVTQPLLPRFRELFHASELAVSLTITAPVLAVAIAAPLVGMLADAIGRKRVIVAAMLGLSVPMMLAGTSSGLVALIAWRFVQGIFIPGIIAVTMALVSEESSIGSVGSTMAIYVTGTVVGGFVGRFVAGIIATHWGWREGFIILGLTTLVCAVLTAFLLPRSTRFVRQAMGISSLLTMGKHLKNPQLLATYAVGFNVLLTLVAAFTYVNFYLADAPFKLGPAALASIFAVYLVGAAITPLAGRLIDRVGYRRAVVLAAAIGACGMLFTLIHQIPTVIVGLTLCATGVFACQSAAASYVGKAAGHSRSSAAGLYVCLYYFGGVAGSFVPGLLWPHTGWPGCVALILLMQIVTASIAAAVWRE